ESGRTQGLPSTGAAQYEAACADRGGGATRGRGEGEVGKKLAAHSGQAQNRAEQKGKGVMKATQQPDDTKAAPRDVPRAKGFRLDGKWQFSELSCRIPNWIAEDICLEKPCKTRPRNATHSMLRMLGIRRDIFHEAFASHRFLSLRHDRHLWRGPDAAVLCRQGQSPGLQRRRP